MAFEKPGRPANNPAEERLRIYASALPVIRTQGARARMSALAEASHMSVGGLYHYFDTKRSLLLHGLNPEALALACDTFHKAMWEATRESPEAVISAYVDKSVLMFRLIQPAASAALEMGVDEIRGQLDNALRQDADGLIQALATVAPDLSEQPRAELATAIRRTLLALSLDAKNATEDDVRRQLTALLHGFITAETRTTG